MGKSENNWIFEDLKGVRGFGARRGKYRGWWEVKHRDTWWWEFGDEDPESD